MGKRVSFYDRKITIRTEGEISSITGQTLLISGSRTANERGTEVNGCPLRQACCALVVAWRRIQILYLIGS
jgi:hypothetical protein